MNLISLNVESENNNNLDSQVWRYYDLQQRCAELCLVTLGINSEISIAWEVIPKCMLRFGVPRALSKACI